MSFWKNKRVLVTGGAGFLGSHLVDDLVLDGAIVTVADNLSRGRMENLRSVSKDIIMNITDLRNIDNCKKVSKGQEIIFNLAGEEANSYFVQLNKRKFFENNMLIIINMLKSAVEQGAERFLQISSSKIYSRKAKAPISESADCELIMDESINPLGLAKRLGEELAKYYSIETDMLIAIARLFNLYGARDNFDLRTCHVIPALVKKVLDNNDPVVVWGSGEQSRSFIYVRDAAKCLKLLIEKYSNSEPVNISSDHLIKIKDLVERIQEITGIHNNVVFDTNINEGLHNKVADISKLRSIIGDLVKFKNIESGLMEVIDYYKSQKKLMNGQNINLDSYYEAE